MRGDPNAVAPYRWEAEYRDGTVVRQFDPVRGFQPSTVLEPQRITALRVLGGPAPIRLQCPSPGPPDEVRIQATTDVALRGGAVGGVSVVRWFGFRYGPRWYLLRIDDAGAAQLTDHFD